MKKVIPLFVMVIGAFFISFAGLPVQDMTFKSLGLDYNGQWRGEQITLKAVPAHENIQLVNFHYAPLPYVMVSLGVGVAAYSVDTCNGRQFTGDFGPSPSAGIDLYSPFFVYNMLRITAGVKANYLYSKNSAETYLYQGAFVSPGAGIIFSANDYIDIEVGGRGLLIFGQMEQAGVAPSNFSNKERARGYLSFLFHSPSEGAYFAFDFDASPAISADWSKGPAEASLGITLGFVLSKRKEKIDPKTDALFPGFKEMQDREDQMKKDMDKNKKQSTD
jgi:hypothetical protein